MTGCIALPGSLIFFSLDTQMIWYLNAPRGRPRVCPRGNGYLKESHPIELRLQARHGRCQISPCVGGQGGGFLFCVAEAGA